MTEQQYVARILDNYRRLPDTATAVRSADRDLARRLYLDGVPLALVLVAFRVAISRRRARPHDAPPLQPIRSLHYFLPVLEEAKHLPAGYLDFIARSNPPDQNHNSGGQLRKQPETSGS